MPLGNKPKPAPGSRPGISAVPPGDNDYTRFFRHYGATSLKIVNHQLQGDCVFPDCEKPHGHFFASPSTGKWDCKFCGRNGNVWDFIREFHAAWYNATIPEYYLDLLEQRPGIDPQVACDWQLAWNDNLSEWMLPAFNVKGEVSNLYVWRDHCDEQGKWSKPVMSSPSPVHQTVYGLEQLSDDILKPLYVLEGHWDTLAWVGLTRRVHDKDGNLLADSCDLLGMPGANTFPKQHIHVLNGRDVRLLSDNDQAGRRARDFLVKAMVGNSTLPAKLGYLSWPEGLREGFDIRDLICEVPK